MAETTAPTVVSKSVKFLETVVFQCSPDKAKWITYEKDKVYDLREDQAERWVRRSKAVFVEEHAPRSGAGTEQRPTTTAAGEADSLPRRSGGFAGRPVHAPDKPDAAKVSDIQHTGDK